MTDNSIFDPPGFDGTEAYIPTADREAQLARALEQLRSSPVLKTVGDRRIGDFWRPDWLRAPFEETLTFRQLLGLKLDVLTKKRSFTPAKIEVLTWAVERALANDSVEKSAQKAPRETSGENGRNSRKTYEEKNLSPAGALSASLWATRDLSLNALQEAVVNLYSEAYIRCQRKVDLFPSLLKLIAATFTQREFVEAWGIIENVPSVDGCSSKLLGKGSGGTKRKKLGANLRASHSERVKYWEGALSGAAVFIPVLAEGTFSHDHPTFVEEGVLKMCIWSLGAEAVSLEQRPKTDVWTKNGKLLSLLLLEATQALPATDKNFRAEISERLPHIPQEIAILLFQDQARYEKKSRRWIRRK